MMDMRRASQPGMVTAFLMREGEVKWEREIEQRWVDGRRTYA